MVTMRGAPESIELGLSAEDAGSSGVYPVATKPSGAAAVDPNPENNGWMRVCG